MNPHAEERHELLPTPPSAAAIDALVEAGMDLERVAPDRRADASRVASLLARLGSVRLRNDQLLVDLAHLRAMRETERQHAEPALSLIPDDEEALDAWMLAGHDASKVPSALRARARRHEAIGTLLAARVPASGSLIERTLQAVETADADRRDRLRLIPDRAAGRRRIRLGDLVSVAATLLIGAAVAWPMVSSARSHAQQTLCQANLGSTALALASYAAANKDSLPVANAGFGGGTWWNVGSDPQASNSANLFSLYTNGYVDLDDLACPGNPHAATDPAETRGFDWGRLEQVSYSYQIIPASRAPTFHANPSRVVLADRSPVILAAARGQPINPGSDSPNHGSRGQHVLHADGSTSWLRTPTLANGDNIWLPRSIEIRIRALEGGRPVDPIKGNELPESADDVFVGP